MAQTTHTHKEPPKIQRVTGKDSIRGSGATVFQRMSDAFELGQPDRPRGTPKK